MSTAVRERRCTYSARGPTLDAGGQSCLELLELELAAAMFGEKIRGGNRGGHDRFNWDDVKNDKFRFVCLSFEKS